MISLHLLLLLCLYHSLQSRLHQPFKWHYYFWKHRNVSPHLYASEPKFKMHHRFSLFFSFNFPAGSLPDNYPFTWRNDSGLYDGLDQNKNLTGGFYDGGGSIKYTFPMAFSVTMLSWSVLEYWDQYVLADQLVEAVSLIQWGVDYLLAAKYENIIFAQVFKCRFCTEIVSESFMMVTVCSHHIFL